MIRFEYDETEFILLFSYKTKGDSKPGYYDTDGNAVDHEHTIHDVSHFRGSGGCVTTCELRYGPIGSRDSEKESSSFGYAYQHPNDQHCKATGRRVALLNLLEQFPTSIMPEMSGNQKFRKAIGKAYHDRNKMLAKARHWAVEK